MINSEQRESPTEFLSWAKKRALEYAEHGNLEGAIDSMVSDLSKDPSRPDTQKQLIGMMGLSLRSKKGLTKKEVIDWINGFN